MRAASWTRSATGFGVVPFASVSESAYTRVRLRSSVAAIAVL